MTKFVLVFGSNEAGIHGAGAAKEAYQKHGARWGFSYGHMGESFAIPTKDLDIQTLPIERVQQYVQGFLAYAKGHPKLNFKVTRIGCGLAGFSDEDIAPLFVGGQANIYYDGAWKDLLTDDSKFWGTF